MNEVSQNSERKNGVALLGATGLVGREVLSLLSADARFDPVVIYVRNVLPTAEKIQLVKTDFVSEDFRLFEKCDTVICALGTTLKRAGSQEAFRAIDFDLVFRIAKTAKERGCRKFLLVSSQGADENSRIFYLRTKGEIEKAVKGFGFETCVIARPALLLGERNEHRPMEEIGKRLFKNAPWHIFPGFINKYEPIEALEVAKALVSFAAEGGIDDSRVLESRELMKIARPA